MMVTMVKSNKDEGRQKGKEKGEGERENEEAIKWQQQKNIVLLIRWYIICLFKFSDISISNIKQKEEQSFICAVRID